VYINESLANLSYDRVNESLGSFSYKDNSIKNPNVYLKVCGINESYLQSFLDLLYSSESGNITISVLSIKPQIYYVSDCILMDIDISPFKALYPAIPFAAIYSINSTNETERIYLEKLNQSFKGSYHLGVDIDDVLKQTYLLVERIFDEENKTIENLTKKYLIFSIVANNISRAEEIVSPGERGVFNYMFSGNETVYVNGIPSLEVRVVEPCTKINESGYYYILNNSAWNLNDTCIAVENVRNIVIDFAEKVIDGNADINGSYAEDKCSIQVKNSANLTLKGVKVQDFAIGICIFDSENIKISGQSIQNNIKGIYTSNSTTKVIRVISNNTNFEIVGENNSEILVSETNISSANISIILKDASVKAVYNPPPDPEGLINISQWVNITKTEDDGFLENIKFHFVFPNERGVMPKVIYKFDGIFLNGTWHNKTWELLAPTYIDLPNKVIFSPLKITNFSIFAPYGEEINITKPQPVPEPTPTPTPEPSAIEGERPEAIPPKLELKLLNETLILEQGATGEVWFNLSNVGKADVYNVRVDADVLRGWQKAFKDFDLIKRNQTFTDKILISVYQNEIPGTYFIPIKAMLKQNNVTVDVEILKVIVIPRKMVARLEILEILPFISLPEYSSIPFSILVRNNGDYDLENVTLNIRNGEKCIDRIDGKHSIKKDERKSLSFTLNTKSAPNKCETVFVLESEKGYVALYPVIIQIVPSAEARVIKILPILLIGWTIITIYVLLRRMKRGR
jgi:hypothetical protein